MSFLDKGLTAGTTYTYKVVATDPYGNSRTSASTSVTITGSSTANKYGNAVAQNNPAHYFRFSGSASTLTNVGGNAPATTKGGLSIVAGNPVSDSGNTVGSFSASSSSYTATKVQGKGPKAFTDRGMVQVH